ncbi:MAG: hypothetical protein ACOC3W_07770 [Thermodesulfobacteriota bacterium]
MKRFVSVRIESVTVFFWVSLMILMGVLIPWKTAALASVHPSALTCCSAENLREAAVKWGYENLLSEEADGSNHPYLLVPPELNIFIRLEQFLG